MYRQNHFSVLTTYPQTTPRKGTVGGDFFLIFFFLNTQSQNQYNRPMQSNTALISRKNRKETCISVQMAQEDSNKERSPASAYCPRLKCRN